MSEIRNAVQQFLHSVPWGGELEESDEPGKLRFFSWLTFGDREWEFHYCVNVVLNYYTIQIIDPITPSPSQFKAINKLVKKFNRNDFTAGLYLNESFGDFGFFMSHSTAYRSHTSEVVEGLTNRAFRIVRSCIPELTAIYQGPSIEPIAVPARANSVLMT